MLSIATAYILKNVTAIKEEAKTDTSLLAENLSAIINLSGDWQQQIKSSTVSRKIIGVAELTDANSSSVPVISSSIQKTFTLSDGGFFQSAARVSQGDYLRNGNKINTEVLRADLKANFESHYNIADDIAYGSTAKYTSMGIYGFGTHPFITRAASVLALSFADTTDAQQLVTQMKAIVHSFIDGINDEADVPGIAVSRSTIVVRMDTLTLNKLKRLQTVDTNMEANKYSAYKELTKYFADDLGIKVEFIEDTGVGQIPLVLKGGTYKVLILGLIEKRYISYENPFAAHLIGGKNAISKDLTGNNVTATFTSMQLGLDVKRKNTIEIWEV